LIESPTAVVARDVIATFNHLQAEPMTEEAKSHVQEYVVGIVFASGLGGPTKSGWIVCHDSAFNVGTSLGEEAVVLGHDFVLDSWRQRFDHGGGFRKC